MNKNEKPISFYEYHKLYGFWGRKNISSKVKFPQSPKKFIDVAHNSIGIREKEIKTLKNSKTILCLGGSNTWGAAINDEDRYSNKLKNYNNFESYNFGQCSFSLEQIYLLIINEAIYFNPHTIIIEQYPWSLTRSINHYVNGYIRPLFYIHKKNFFQKKLNFYLANKTIRKFAGNYLKFKKDFAEYYNKIHACKDKEYTDPIYKNSAQDYYIEMYEIVRHVVDKIANFCRAKNIKLLFIVTPSKEEIYKKTESEDINYALPRKNLLKIFDNLNISYIDVSNEFMISYKEVSPIFSDGHANELGNTIIAKKIKDKLQ